MAHAPAPPADMTTPHPPLGGLTVQAPPVTNGKLAMWLFLATEIMFFTGLIGSYIVLRIGSPHWPTPTSIRVQVKQTDGSTNMVKGDLVEEGKDKIAFKPEHWEGAKLPKLAAAAKAGAL